MMLCPKCNKPMRVTNTFNAGKSAKTQRLECPDIACGTSGTAVVFVFNTDPILGEGAKSVARKIAAGSMELAVKNVRKK